MGIDLSSRSLMKGVVFYLNTTPSDSNKRKYCLVEDVFHNYCGFLEEETLELYL